MTISNPTKSKSTSGPNYLANSVAFNRATGGRAGRFARNGTPELTAEQIQAYGGLGATRVADVNRLRKQALDEIAADPNLTVSQRQRSTQLTDQEVAARLDAINKETEAGIAGLAQYNNELDAKDLELLAKIFYGSGSYSKSNTFGGGSASYG